MAPSTHGSVFGLSALPGACLVLTGPLRGLLARAHSRQLFRAHRRRGGSCFFPAVCTFFRTRPFPLFPLFSLPPLWRISSRVERDMAIPRQPQRALVPHRMGSFFDCVFVRACLLRAPRCRFCGLELVAGSGVHLEPWRARVFQLGTVLGHLQIVHRCQFLIFFLTDDYATVLFSTYLFFPKSRNSWDV